MNSSITSNFNFQGELFALGAALLWAVSSILFNRVGKTVRPLELNLLKGLGALVLLSATSLFLGEQLRQVGMMTLLILAVSGAVGIGFGDTMFFEALNRLGARRALLITILAPPMTAVLALLFLKESMSALSWLGIGITVLGVAWVITEKNGPDALQTKPDWKGVFFGFLAALTQAIGAVLSRWALTETTVSALQSAVFRLLAGVAVLILWVVIRRERVGTWLKPRPSMKFWGTIAAVVFLGTYVAIWFQQLAFQHTRVGIAQTLLATSPLFILPFAALQGEKLSPRAILGVVLSLAGVGLLFLAV